MRPIDLTPLLGPGLVLRKVVVPSQDVVYVRGIFEASCGVAVVYSISGGDLTIAATESRVAELERLLADLQAELGPTMLIQRS